jgi:hypothetical protein
MQYSAKSGMFLSAILLALAASAMPVTAQDLPASVCEVVIHDELAELEDARINIDLAKSTFAAYEKILQMLESLWAAGTVPRMDYLKAKYDRDAAKLALEASDLILERQAALVEQYRLICNGAGSGSGTKERASAIRKAYVRYRRADCSSLAKAIEVAATKLEYNREFLKKTLELRREKFATNTQVILAELDVEHEEKSLADAKHRTATCRSELPGLEAGVYSFGESEGKRAAN